MTRSARCTAGEDAPQSGRSKASRVAARFGRTTGDLARIRELLDVCNALSWKAGLTYSAKNW